MKASNLYFPTLKESPSDAEISSHKLMLRAGLIRKLASGLYTWLPLGLKVLRKVETIVREEMDNIDAQEILMPAVQPSELWEETNRWQEFGPQLLKIVDRHKREFCFGPTHEEVITDLVRNELKSYKQLPKSFYQIQTKFRDEIRPRFGVMRAREFLMKDAYTFHLTEECLENTYDKMYQAYTNIFTRLGLNFRAVLADTGAIGGSKSHEFHALADAGEDELIFAPNGEYAANVELATAMVEEVTDEKPLELSKKQTPNIKSVADQASHMGLKTKQILKTLLVKGASDDHPVVALLVRGDHDLNPTKAEKHEFVARPFELISEEKVKEIAGCNPGFVGPINLNIPLIADLNVIKMQNFSCGANINDEHYINVNWGRDLKKLGEGNVFDLKTVKKGDLSPDGSGELDVVRGAEVGHIFMLGDKYSKSMNATVLDENGKARYPLMGCYGIGISRIIAAAIEQNFDDKGIVWPKAMAPFEVAIVAIDFHKSEDVKNKSLEIYESFKSKGVSVLLDDRNERPGIKFKDMELIGVPKRFVVSKKTLAENKIEYKERGSEESILLSFAQALKKIIVKAKKEHKFDRNKAFAYTLERGIKRRAPMDYFKRLLKKTKKKKFKDESNKNKGTS